MSRFVDLTGQKFGRLTVVERADDQVSQAGNKKIMWLCKCECGNFCIVNSSHLRNGHTQSCGCYHRERLKNIGDRSKRFNEYVFEKNYVIGYTNKGIPFFIDREDYEKVQPYCWSINGNGYLGARGAEDDHLLIHRLIMNAQNGELVDHKNHDLMDNRKCNLRIVTDAKNRLNVKKRSNNTSGVTGVYFCKNGTYMARIGVKGEDIFLGSFNSFDDAVAVRKAAEEKYFGEFSYDNSIAAVPRISV